MRILSAAFSLCCTVHAAPWSLHVTDKHGAVMPCRMHLRDSGGNSVKPPSMPFWSDRFVFAGEVQLELTPGDFHYEIERGPKPGMRLAGSSAPRGPHSITNQP